MNGHALAPCAFTEYKIRSRRGDFNVATVVLLRFTLTAYNGASPARKHPQPIDDATGTVNQHSKHS